MLGESKVRLRGPRSAVGGLEGVCGRDGAEVAWRPVLAACACLMMLC